LGSETEINMGIEKVKKIKMRKEIKVGRKIEIGR
jgi:hypothetical protein